MKISGIYKIESKLKPHRIYIGSGINISQRWRRHLSDLRHNRHWSGKLQNHFNKYGESDLIFSILTGCDKEELIQNEQFFIDLLNPFFNNAKIAGNNLGMKHSIETKMKMSKQRKGKKHSVDHIENLTIARRKRGPYSEESKLKISLSGKGRIPWNKGKKGVYSEETLQKMRGKVFTKEYLDKLSKTHKGIIPSKETRMKMSIAGRNRIFTDLHKQHLKEAWKLRKLNKIA